MRLIEIIDTKKTTKTHKSAAFKTRDELVWSQSTPDELDNIDTGLGNNTPKKGRIGRGAFFDVEDDERDDHVVIKKSRFATDRYTPEHETDAFDAFVELIIEHDMTSNIHFPRIYAKTTNVDSGKKAHREYSIERLTPHGVIGKKHLIIAYKQLYANELQAEKDLSEVIKSEEPDWPYTIEDAMTEAMGYRVEDMISGSTPISTYSVELDSAIEFLRMCYTDSKYSGQLYLDLQPDNIMFRRTPYGYQIVFNDPFA